MEKTIDNLKHKEKVIEKQRSKQKTLTAAVSVIKDPRFE